MSEAAHAAFAAPEDLDYLDARDRHVGRDAIRGKISRREIAVVRRGGERAGFLRFGYFWDEIPFMNLLWVEEGLRGGGLGTHLVSFWEDEMRSLGHEWVMTSALSNERAQHLYRRLGYRDCGSLLMPGDPLEILFLKQLA